MKQLQECPVCSSEDFYPYSFVPEQARGDGLHFSQSRCRRCDLVFSNPVAELSDIESFYKHCYYRKVEAVYNMSQPDIEEKILARAVDAGEGLCQMILPYRSEGVFFEIGAGWGPVLFAARKLGFRVAGVEPSKDAAEFAQKKFGLKQLKCSLFYAGDWPESWVDVVYSHHTIEHVLDVRDFVDGMRRILKPGGIAVIGTENYRCAYWDSRRFIWRLRGVVMPEFISGASEHTYVFSRKSLCEVMERGGFEVFKTWVYTLSFKEKHSGKFRSFFSKAYAYSLHLTDIAFRRGGRIYIWCRKK